SHYFDNLIVFQTLGSLGQVRCQINPHFFFAESGRNKKFAELDEVPCHESELLLEFSRGSFFRSLTFIESACGHFEQVADCGVAILAHERNGTISEDRHNHSAAGMMDHLA